MGQLFFLDFMMKILSIILEALNIVEKIVIFKDLVTGSVAKFSLTVLLGQVFMKFLTSIILVLVKLMLIILNFRIERIKRLKFE